MSQFFRSSAARSADQWGYLSLADAVTSRPESIPDVSRIVSIGEAVADETLCVSPFSSLYFAPSDLKLRSWRVITPYEAKEIFGSRVARLEGDTVRSLDSTA